MVDDYVNDIFGTSMHLKRIQSFVNATSGGMHSLSLSIHIIGQGLAQAKDLTKKHCVKQVDRLLCNPKIDVWEYFSDWASHILSEKETAFNAMDWIEFDADNHSNFM